MNDRRKHTRLPITMPVEIKTHDAQPTTISTTTTDVSTGGIRFASHADSLQPGQHVAVHMTVPPAPGRSSAATLIDANATILRVDPTSNVDRVNIACRFDSDFNYN